jgi:hypothetical protein
MKTFTTALAAAGLAACVALPAQAARVCLQTILIDHTSVKDPNTVLFYLKNGQVWRNTLQAPCPSITMHGFEMSVRTGADKVCSNEMTIHTLVTHQTCSLGEFTPYAPPAKAPADKS